MCDTYTYVTRSLCFIYVNSYTCMTCIHIMDMFNTCNTGVYLTHVLQVNTGVCLTYVSHL